MDTEDNHIENVKSGSLLISTPFLGDPIFDRTVILICEHNKDGSFGLVLNQETNFKIQDFNLFENANFDDLVYMGGPVQNNTIHFVHKYADLKHGLEIAKNVFWGGDFEELKKRISKSEIELANIRFFLGYSGWDAGQIDAELKRNTWVVNNSYSSNLFKINPTNLWKTVLKSMGGKYAEMANYPIDPSLN